VAAISLKVEDLAAEREFMAKLYTELKGKGVPAYAFPRLIIITNE